MTRVRLAELRSLNERYPGMMDLFLSKGEVQGLDVAVVREDFEAINRQFFGDGFKLGSAVHAVAQPFAKAVDSVLGTSLSSCGGCGARELELNAATSKDPPGQP